MYSIQEMVGKSENQIRDIKRSLGSGSYHPEEASIFHGQKASVSRTLRESLRNIPLSEFLGKSGTAGIAGAAYLVPNKIHDLLVTSSKVTDICPLVGYVVEGWQGGDLLVPIVRDEAFRPRLGSGGGETATGVKLSSTQATLEPVKFDLALSVDKEMIEDSNYGLVEWIVRNAGKGIGYKATDLILAVLKVATDGDGTLNTALTGDADETNWTAGTTTDIETAIGEVGDDMFIANTLLTTPESWKHSIASDAGATAGLVAQPPRVDGFHGWIDGLDVLKCVSVEMHDPDDAPGAAMTACNTFVFDRYNAVLTGRKRWMALDNYSDPLADLSGAVVSCRQDSVTLYNDAIYYMMET